MKITVHEAAQRTRNEVYFEDVQDIIEDVADKYEFTVFVTTSSELEFSSEKGLGGDCDMWVRLFDLGFKEASGGKLVADKSAASVLSALSKKLMNYVSVDPNDAAISPEFFDDVKNLAKGYSDKAKDLRQS